MAEYVMKNLVKKEGLSDHFVIDSAATCDDEIGNPVYPPARRMLNQHGIACDGHKAHQMQRSDYSHYDLLIGMEDRNLVIMRRICGGDPDKKIKRILDYTDHHGNVADPYFTGDFEATWRDVNAGCRALLEELKKSTLL